ncbi:sensor histidine kinase [Nocardiopsis tropica]|uniref:histidine kinase n=1 Tax=Nocardiopsis tropica TaxID=109330 RepID=A0ABU7KYR8_9ACTN|nr:histidine kinase [Nocardiopsis umidischolae]MEE2054451.1 histidine kinase [Nocardiopsis umidischolae]
MKHIFGRWSTWGADAGLAVLTLAPPLVSQVYADTTGTAWAWFTGYEAVAGAAVLAGRRWPATAFVAALGALVVALVGSSVEGVKLTPLVFLPLAVLLYGLGSHCASWRRTVLAVGAGSAMVLAGLSVNRLAVSASEFNGGFDVLSMLAPMPLAWAMGFAARTRRELLAAAEERAAEATRAQRLREEQAAQRERARIAREMHDVVAHSLTLLVVHAETLRARGGELPAWARAQVDGLAAAGRRSGGELREMLRMLRDPADAVPLRPLPGLGELDTLLDSHRTAGGTAEVRVDAGTEELPGPVQAAVYRVVQESLANARRHAPGAPVRLTVAVDRDTGRLRLEVVNGPGTRPGEVGAGTGLGVVGMRARTDALGGELDAGPTADGGFRVLAAVPLETVDA